MPDPAIDPRGLARHLDRIRRLHFACREGVSLVPLSRGGWLSAAPNAPRIEFASMSASRVYWIAIDEPVSQAQIDEAAAAVRGSGCSLVHIWLAPWAWNPAVETALTRAGATRIPHVDYIALARAADAASPAPNTPIDLRPVEPQDAPSVMSAVAPWFSTDGADRVLRSILLAGNELHAAFDGPKPVAVGLLAIDADWGYLNAAGTDPAYRNRGLQTALIHARLRGSALRGAKTCSCETNTAVPTSLRNLRRCGFQDIIRWRVYAWDFA